MKASQYSHVAELFAGKNIVVDVGNKRLIKHMDYLVDNIFNEPKKARGRTRDQIHLHTYSGVIAEYAFCEVAGIRFNFIESPDDDVFDHRNIRSYGSDVEYEGLKIEIKTFKPGGNAIGIGRNTHHSIIRGSEVSDLVMFFTRPVPIARTTKMIITPAVVMPTSLYENYVGQNETGTYYLRHLLACNLNHAIELNSIASCKLTNEKKHDILEQYYQESF